MSATDTHHKLIDDLAIRDLNARYTDAVNQYNPLHWINCWTDDARWNLMGTRVTGKENILSLWQQLMSDFEFALIMPSSSLFTLNPDLPDRASGHSYQHEYTRDKAGNGHTLLGRYLDEYRKIDDEWYFQTREYQILYRGNSDLTGQFTLPPR